MNTSARLLITETARSVMTAAAARAHPYETGGVLIGVYTDGHPWIIAAPEIGSPDRGRTHYRIPGGATHDAVMLARAFDDRLGYLGDWHTHPSDVGPSPTDLATLALISVRHPLLPNPTQIVVRRTEDSHALDARRIIGLTPRACTIRLTGNLPAQTPPPSTDRGADLP
jgi:integrative and conjugative element protein (TIGR02256 family)